MGQRLGIGLIGAGGILRRHAEAYRSLAKLATLVAVADVDLSRALVAKREHGFKETFGNYRDLLKRQDIQVVDICTPPHLHASMVIDALEAGKHVLCEKPMSRTLEEADREIAAADNYPHLKASCVFQYRSDPTHSRVRAVIERGLLGRILLASVRVRAQRKPAYYALAPGRASYGLDGGGVLMNQAIHQLDSLLWFLGSPATASAAMKTFLQPTEAEDTLVGWVRFENGALATIDCTVCAHGDWFEIELLGEHAQTAIRGNCNQHYCVWQLESKSSAVERALRSSGLREFPDLPRGPNLWTVRAQKLASRLRGRSWLPPPHWGHTPHVREFLECIRTDSEAPVPPREARRSLELSVGLYAAAVTGEVVNFPLDDSHRFYRGVSGDDLLQVKAVACS